jgi:hypothetical protein
MFYEQKDNGDYEMVNVSQECYTCVEDAKLFCISREERMCKVNEMTYTGDKSMYKIKEITVMTRRYNCV